MGGRWEKIMKQKKVAGLPEVRPDAFDSAVRGAPNVQLPLEIVRVSEAANKNNRLWARQFMFLLIQIAESPSGLRPTLIRLPLICEMLSTCWLTRRRTWLTTGSNTSSMSSLKWIIKVR